MCGLVETGLQKNKKAEGAMFSYGNRNSWQSGND